MSFNIQSIHAKFSDFSHFIYSCINRNCEPDIICLQELWQFPSDADFTIDGYKPLIYKLRNGTQGGGVGIYIANHINAVYEPSISFFCDRIFETIFIELTISSNKKIILGSAYRPGSKHPSMNSGQQFESFMESLRSLLDNLLSRNVPVYIFGDINLDVLRYSNCNNVTEYINLLFSHGFIQTVTLPTRCTSNSASIIDHCITNSSTDFNSIILTSNISDHFPILHFLSDTGSKSQPKFINYHDFSDTNVTKFCNNLSAINWDPLYNLNDTQAAYDYFSERFFLLHQLYFPLGTKKFNIKYHKKDPWFTSGLLVSRREKFRLEKLAIRTCSHVNIDKFKKYRNI